MRLNVLIGILSASIVVGCAPNSDNIIGVWSFDGTCRTSWGMEIKPDGNVSFDMWGVGVWARPLDGSIMLMLEANKEEMVEKPETLFLRDVKVSKDQMTFTLDGTRITARKCR